MMVGRIRIANVDGHQDIASTRNLQGAANGSRRAVLVAGLCAHLGFGYQVPRGDEHAAVTNAIEDVVIGVAGIDVSLGILPRPEVRASVAPIDVGIGIRSDPPPSALPQHGVPETSQTGGHLIEPAHGGMSYIRAARASRVQRSISIDGDRLAPRGPCHADCNVWGGIVPITQLLGCCASVDPEVRRGARRMVCDDERCPRELTHESQRLDHLVMHIALGIGGIDL